MEDLILSTLAEVETRLVTKEPIHEAVRNGIESAYTLGQQSVDSRNKRAIFVLQAAITIGVNLDGYSYAAKEALKILKGES